jgi:TonB-dependent SusC/RagA subfamily outer membrane receptor
MKKSVPILRCFYPKLLFKCLLMMKFTVLFVLFATIQARATVYSQTVSIKVEQTEIKRVLNTIEKKTNVRFVYNYELEGLKKKVDFSVQDLDVLTALEKLLSGSGLKYQMLGNHMIAILAEGVQEHPFAVITGKITDQNNSPISNVDVQVQGTNTGTMTDNSGNFSISASTDAVLLITAVGYNDTTVALAGRTTLNIQLRLATRALDEVVVVGYGTARKKDLTGAVASVSSKDFNVGAISDPMQQIQGKVAGVQIIQSSGDPNQGLNIKLRGQASLSGSQTPLIVLDGVPLSDPTQISNLLPADIASYDVLKDASAAAIYGSQGANGVIIINTKKGSAGQIRVDYNGFATYSEVAKYYPLLNLQEWKTGSLNYLISQGNSPGLADTTVAAYGNGNTDWQKAITRKTLSENQSIAVSGGTGHLNFRGSLDYLDQEGVVIDSYKKGVGLNLSVEEKAIDNRLDIQLGLTNSSYTRNETDPTQLAFPLYNPPA